MILGSSSIVGESLHGSHPYVGNFVPLFRCLTLAMLALPTLGDVFISSTDTKFVLERS